ncbi:MAG TPA: hypothetical protein VHC69_19680 [Polyangiaceae bacterium]|nr:hypothetical protein [Polyangiaceae bacterium]
MTRAPVRGSSRARYGAWIAAGALGLAALYPAVTEYRARATAEARLDALDASLRKTNTQAPLDPGTALRVTRLGPLLSSWETVGGCGAGSTGGTGVVKWIGRSTTGGLFQSITQFNYIHFTNGYNLVATEQITRDIDEHWNVGVFVPWVYKWYDNPFGLSPPVDISNAGFGDINLLGTFRFGPINENSLMASLGLPTGTSGASYKGSLLTQEKQLGIGNVTGSLMLDHTMDETWGLIVLGGLGAWRGGQNSYGSYRAPMASLYGYGGYFMGPFVPALGVSFTGFLKPDRDQGIEQDVPLLLVAANASIEWSNDLVAVLVGVSFPFGLYAKKDTEEQLPGTQPSSTGIQPWTAAIGVSVSPF